MYLLRPPLVYRWLFKEALFRKNRNLEKVYLTFDDGPNSEATEFVLNTLKEQEIKATFFMLGKNVVSLPALTAKVKDEGHRVANHGMEHLNGWNTSATQYAQNCEDGRRITESRLFRPPYGRLTLSQYNQLRKECAIVFWDVISGDFDTTIAPDRVVRNVLNSARNGSIIVMHDSAKALPNLKGSLKEIIIGLKKRGFEFDVL